MLIRVIQKRTNKHWLAGVLFSTLVGISGFAQAMPTKTAPPLTRRATSLETAAVQSTAALSGKDQVRLVRAGEFSQVAGKLSAREDLSSELALVLGAALVRLENYDGALPHFAVAAAGLPALSHVIDEQQRAALLRSSQYRTLLPAYASSRNADELLLLAERLVDDGSLGEATQVLGRASKFARGKDVRVRLRLLKARLSLSRSRPYVALHDLRWVATRAPLHPLSSEAEALLSQHFPRQPLTPKQREARAKAFANAGAVELLDRELAASASPRASRRSRAQAAHLIAWAQYKARRFKTAAPLFLEAAELAGPAGQEDLYYAARSFSRSGQPKLAIDVFEAVLAARPKTRYAGRAAFRLARQWALLGQPALAVQHYQSYLKRFSNHENTETAKRELAIALYQSGRSQSAADAFRRLRLRAPGARRAPMYQSLQAVSLLAAGERAEAIGLLKQLAQSAPLSFEGWMSRARLVELAEPIASPQAPPPLALSFPQLPESVKILHDLGLDEWAEAEFAKHERDYYAAGSDRYRGLCEAYGQLQAGRRRYLLGFSAAKQNQFYSAPGEAARWVWECLYPTPYRALVEQAASDRGVPASFIYAVMRQESGFRPTVRSPAAAFGLMQIIEPTAREVASELSLDYRHEILLEPSSNITMGAHYLRKTLNYFDSQAALAAAAYNAGPDAVSHWEHGAQGLPLEMFIARIPYDETRAYVAKVLASAWIYESLYTKLGAIKQPPLVKKRTQASSPVEVAERSK